MHVIDQSEYDNTKWFNLHFAKVPFKIAVKTKSRFIVNGVFKRKKYFYEEAGHTALQIYRINMYATKSNFKANQDNFTCPKCNTHNDSTEHIVECYTDLSSSELKKEDSEHWGKIIKAFKSYTEDAAIIRTAK